MNEETSVVGIYPDHSSAEQAVARLREAAFDVTKLSIIGKDYHTEERIVGYYTTGERMKYWGLRGAFWGGIWGALLGAGSFLIPGVGSVLVAGPVLGALLMGFETAALMGGLSALAIGLVHLGIPEEEALKYENAIKADNFLVIAHGTSEEVVRARLILVDASAS